MTKSNIIIYTDGGCRGNQNGKDNVGGWGVFLEYNGHTKELYGGVKETTNNKMELQGAIESLKALKTTNLPVRIHCDSAYVIMGITQWTKTWVKKGWRKSDGKPVENKELWQELVELSSVQEDLQFIKVKGHCGIFGNEKADELANRGMDEIEQEKKD